MTVCAWGREGVVPFGSPSRCWRCSIHSELEAGGEQSSAVGHLLDGRERHLRRLDIPQEVSPGVNGRGLCKRTLILRRHGVMNGKPVVATRLSYRQADQHTMR